jgi:hypothetical protein
MITPVEKANVYYAQPPALTEAGPNESSLHRSQVASTDQAYALASTRVVAAAVMMMLAANRARSAGGRLEVVNERLVRSSPNPDCADLRIVPTLIRYALRSGIPARDIGIILSGCPGCTPAPRRDCAQDLLAATRSSAPRLE